MEDIVLLDTNVVIDFFAKQPTAAITERLLLDARTALSVITVYELFNGVENKKHIKQRETFIQFCEIIDINITIARKAADIYTNLKKTGKLISHEDIFIAACALNRNYSLFTLNKTHFENIKYLTFYE